MTSKEALEELNVILKTNYGTKLYSDIFEENLIKVIEKDLEILQIIKANKNIIFSKNPNYEDMNADDYFKICWWLSNDE